MTQDEVKQRAGDLVRRLKKDGMTPDEALNMCNVAVFIMIVAMAEDAADAHAGVDAAALALHNGIDTLEPRQFNGVVAHGTA